MSEQMPVSAVPPGPAAVLGASAIRYVLWSIAGAKRLQELNKLPTPAAVQEIERQLQAVLAVTSGASGTSEPTPADAQALSLLVTAQEVAEVTGWSDRWIRKLCADGSLATADDSSGRWLIERAELDAFMSSRSRR